ncbi:hypothetical protein [Streptomyces sp. NBC_00019]|uniref:hypothetical protein n=1 Tax=Streptomyces sp. NBC_00019 TaxID=2975623 RepID=UPI003255D6B2
MTQPPTPPPDPQPTTAEAPPRKAAARKPATPKAPAAAAPQPQPQPAASSSDVVNAISALTTFLRNGSQKEDPQAFSPAQLNIQRDFRDLLAGLGRGSSDPPGKIVRPVLSNGLLELGAPLPDEAVSIGGFHRTGTKIGPVWRVKVAEATKYPGDPTHLRHKDIVVDRVVRLRAFDASGRRILTGVPKIADTPSRPTS